MYHPRATHVHGTNPLSVHVLCMFSPTKQCSLFVLVLMGIVTRHCSCALDPGIGAHHSGDTEMELYSLSGLNRIQEYITRQGIYNDSLYLVLLSGLSCLSGFHRLCGTIFHYLSVGHDPTASWGPFSPAITST